HFIAGLCSHFRDLLVCKDAQTVQLLEASESVKARYREQAISCDASFLFEALSLANRCDVGYKASGNPRLHVELCLLQISYLCAEKKKPDVAQPPAPAIPAAAAAAAGSSPSATTPPSAVSSAAAANPASLPAAPKPAVELPKTVQIKAAISSISEKKPPHSAAALPSSAEKPAAAAIAIAQDFTAEQLQEVCQQYAAALPERKARVRSAVLSASKAIKDDRRTITMTLGNDAILREVEPEKETLVYYLRQHLRNAQVEVELQVEEAPAKWTKPYGGESCYKFMVEQNPLLATLKQKLDLDYE
ncbi:MAG: hypothetical protein LBF55_04645, partial [Prevotellaceae bacterium]|nr:hypothetical protein [Prevotellaceae bacterium]